MKYKFKWTEHTNKSSSKRINETCGDIVDEEGDDGEEGRSEQHSELIELFENEFHNGV